MHFGFGLGGTGELVDLDSWPTTAGRDAGRPAPTTTPTGPMYLCNLGSSSAGPVRGTGELAELDEVITAIRSAVTATAEDSPGTIRLIRTSSGSPYELVS